MQKENQNYVFGSEKESDNNVLSIFVFDSIFISETTVVNLIVERITIWEGKSEGSDTVVSVEEYRQLLNDFITPTERIQERLQYLESFCRNIIKPELKKIYEQSKKNIL